MVRLLHRWCIPQVVVLAGFAWGCAADLPVVTEVEDLRILAIRADPPQLLDDPFAEGVRFTALVVDPRQEALGAQTIELEWTFCPVESGRACLDYDELIDRAVAGVAQTADSLTGAGAEVEELPAACSAALGGFAQDVARLQLAVIALSGRAHWDAYRTPVVGPELLLRRDPGVGEIGLSLTPIDFVPRFARAFEQCAGLPAPADVDALPPVISDLHLFHFLDNPVGALLGALPSVSLRATVGEETLLASKRLPVTFRQPRTPITLLSVFSPGQSQPLAGALCPPGVDQQVAAAAGCLLFRSRVENTNPQFSAIEVARGKEADAPFASWAVFEAGELQPPEPLMLSVGESLRLRPQLTSASFELYQSVHADPKDFSLSLRDTDEQLSVAWFSTAGSWKEETTYDKNTKTLDNRFTAPDDVPQRSDGIVDVWLVVRDNRGGTAWQRVEIRVVAGDQ